MCTTSEVFVLPGAGGAEDDPIDRGLTDGLLLDLTFRPFTSLVDLAHTTLPTNTPLDTHYSTRSTSSATPSTTGITLQTHDHDTDPSQPKLPTPNAPNKDCTTYSTGNTTKQSSARYASTNLVPLGHGDRRKPYKGSRIPPGVRPWLSQRLEEMWNIDGHVYSHYILSVLLDGVDNEELVDDVDLEDLKKPRKPRHGGCKKWNEKDDAKATQFECDDSFDARRKAAFNYLSSFSLDEDEVHDLVEELLTRLGFPSFTPSPRHSRRETPQKEIKNCGARYVRSLGRGRSLSSTGVAKQNCLLKTKRNRSHAFPNGSHGVLNDKKKNSGLGVEDETEGRKNTRPRFASLDDCRYIMPIKNLSKGTYSAKLGARDAINEEAVSESWPRHLAHSFSSESTANAGEFCHGNALRACSFQSLIDILSCVSTEPDEESCFDLELDFNHLQVDDDPDYDETYNEAFPALLGIENHEAKLPLGSVFISGSVATQECGKALPPNPITGRGQPVWSTKVKAPVGRPLNLNRRYFDAQVSNVITEEVTTVDEASQTVNVREGTPNGTEKQHSCEASEVETEVPKVVRKGAGSRLLSSSDFDFDLSDILKMVGMTPEKWHEKRNMSKPEDTECNGNSSAISKCLKDLFCNEEQQASTSEIDTGLFSPELSKIWDNESLQQSAESSTSNNYNSIDSKEIGCDSNASDQKSVRKVSGTLANDSVWMPTKEELGRRSSVSTAGLIPSFFKVTPGNQESANDDDLYNSKAVFELLSDFPGMMKDDDTTGFEGATALIYDNDNDDNPVWSDEMREEFARDARVFDDYFFLTAYNPRLFRYDLLGSSVDGILGLGSFYKKRDMYFDEFFSENFGPAADNSCHLPVEDFLHFENNAQSEREFLHPVLTEHFLVELMKFNEQNTQISTPVSSELDGSLFDDKASEVTATCPLLQRANSLILKHQRFNDSNSDNSMFSRKPKMCDVALQTDDSNNEEHRFSPVHSSSNVTTVNEATSEGDAPSPVIAQQEKIAEQDMLGQHNESDEFAPTNSSLAAKNEGVTDLAKSFECPAGCKHSDETGSQSNVPEENLLISPKTHFRPISVQSIENECGYEEKLVMQQTFDGIPVPNTLQLTSNTKDSRLFSTWFQGLNNHNFEISTQWQPENNFENTMTNENSLWKSELSTEVRTEKCDWPNSQENKAEEYDDNAWKSGILRNVNCGNATNVWNEQFPVLTANSATVDVNNLDFGESQKFNDNEIEKKLWESVLKKWRTTETNNNDATPDWLTEIDNNNATTSDWLTETDKNIETTSDWLTETDKNNATSDWLTETDKNNATSDWLTLPSNQFANTVFEYGANYDVNVAYLDHEDTAATEAIPFGTSGATATAAECEELEFIFDHEMAGSFAHGLNHANPAAGFQSEYPVGFLPMETLEDVNCKCVADLPGELGIDPLCQLHGGGAAIYLTTATGDNNSVVSGGDWSMGSNCSLGALPPTTAINPNIIGFQAPIGSSRNKKQTKKSVLAANSILPIDESLVSQKQKQKQKQKKKKRAACSNSMSEKENKCSDKPCSYFLEGACHRLDCKFSHDLASIPCRFFAEGACFKSYFCPFSHALPVASTSVPAATTLGDPIPVSEKLAMSLLAENSAELKSCSLDSAAEILFVAKDDAIITSDSDSVAGTFGTPDVDIVTSLGKGPPKVCKRRRTRAGARLAKQKQVPNITDKAEFPILPNEKDTNKCEGQGTAVQLSLRSIYPKEGFGSIKSEAVV